MKYEITNKELNEMKYLGKGNFGTAYTDGVNVIKVWHKFCRTDDLSLIPNPCYNLDKANSRKFRRLNKKSNSLIFSDIGIDEVYLDCNYVGVKKKYYDGLTLDKLVYLPLEEKKIILLKLIRNIEELINNNIYSLDCKLDNVIVTKDGEVKLVDLDDFFTKVPVMANPLYKRKCLLSLKKTIINFLYYNQFQFYTSSLEVIANSSIEKENIIKKLSIDELKNFVKNIKMSDNIFVVSIDEIDKIDLKVFKSYLTSNHLDLILTIFDKVYYNNFFVKKVKELNGYGIDVYDMVLCKGDVDKLSWYISSHDCNNVYVYENGNIVYKSGDEEVKPKRRG